MSFIKKLQEKPRATRVLILWLASFLIMAVIIVIWLFSFSRGFGTQKAEKEVEKTNLPSLFESIGRDFSIFRQELEASLKNIKINEGEK